LERKFIGETKKPKGFVQLLVNKYINSYAELDPTNYLT